MSKSAQKILNVAEQLFNEHSFVAVGVDLIRDESGCSKTTLYTYFKNKQQLVCSVLQQRDLRFRESLTTFVAEHRGLEALEKIFVWHQNWFQTGHFKGCLFVRAVGESSQQDLELIEIAKQHKLWLRNFIFENIQDLKFSHQITEMSFNLLEGLISRFLVEMYDEKVFLDTQSSLYFWVKTLQLTTE